MNCILDHTNIAEFLDNTPFNLATEETQDGARIQTERDRTRAIDAANL